MNSQYGSYVQPYQLTYEMYNNPISNNIVYDFKGVSDMNKYQRRQSRIQTAASEQCNYSEYYSQSYKDYLNGKYNEERNERRRSQSKSMDDRENNERSRQEGGNIIHSMSMNDMRNNSGMDNNLRKYNENNEIGGGLNNTNDSLYKGNGFGEVNRIYGKYNNDNNPIINNERDIYNRNRSLEQNNNNPIYNTNIPNNSIAYNVDDNKNNIDPNGVRYQEINNQNIDITNPYNNEISTSKTNNIIPSKEKEYNFNSLAASISNPKGDINHNINTSPRFNSQNDSSILNQNKDNMFNPSNNNNNPLRNPITDNKKDPLSSEHPIDEEIIQKSIINSLDEISSLSPQEQIQVLFNNNRALAQSLRTLQSQYDNLKSEYDKTIKLQGIEKNNNSKELKNLLLKENNELKMLNKNYENILEPLVDYVNEVNVAMGKEEIDLLQIKKMTKLNANKDPNKEGNNTDNDNKDTSSNPIEEMKVFLNNCHKDIVDNIDDMNKAINQKNPKRKKKLTSHSNNNASITNNTNNNNTSNQLPNRDNKFNRNPTSNTNNNNMINNNSDLDAFYGYDYYGDRNNCFACNLGCNCSSRGYSPLMCSPNRNKYLRKEVPSSKPQ